MSKLMKRVPAYCDLLGFTAFFIFYIIDAIHAMTGNAGGISWGARIGVASFYLMCTLIACIPSQMYGNGGLDPLK